MTQKIAFSVLSLNLLMTSAVLAEEGKILRCEFVFKSEMPQLHIFKNINLLDVIQRDSKARSEIIQIDNKITELKKVLLSLKSKKILHSNEEIENQFITPLLLKSITEFWVNYYDSVGNVNLDMGLILKILDIKTYTEVVPGIKGSSMPNDYSWVNYYNLSNNLSALGKIIYTVNTKLTQLSMIKDLSDDQRLAQRKKIIDDNFNVILLRLL